VTDEKIQKEFMRIMLRYAAWSLEWESQADRPLYADVVSLLISLETPEPKPLLTPIKKGPKKKPIQND
jgi:hypothetical protein